MLAALDYAPRGRLPAPLNVRPAPPIPVGEFVLLGEPAPLVLVDWPGATLNFVLVGGSGELGYDVPGGDPLRIASGILLIWTEFLMFGAHSRERGGKPSAAYLAFLACRLVFYAVLIGDHERFRPFWRRCDETFDALVGRAARRFRGFRL